MSGRPLLVTGTDTGAGKTLVTAMLASALTIRGIRVGVAKPVETGCRVIDGELYGEDAATLIAAAHRATPIERVCPHRFPDPLAPAIAAARAGTRIDVDALVALLREATREANVMLIEGAGGILVPIADRFSFADLAAALAATVLVVVGSRLGALNHALLTFEVLAARQIPLRGYVVNRLAPPGDLAADTNAAALAGLSDLPMLGELPPLAHAGALLTQLRAGGNSADRAREELGRLAADHLDLDRILAEWDHRTSLLTDAPALMPRRR